MLNNLVNHCPVTYNKYICVSVCSSVAFFVLYVFNKHSIITQNRFTSYVYLRDVLYFTDTAEDGVEEDGVSFDTTGVGDVEIVILLINNVVSSVLVCECIVEVKSVVVIDGVKNEVDGTDVVTVDVKDDTQVHSLSEDKGMTFTCGFIDLMVMRMQPCMIHIK